MDEDFDRVIKGYKPRSNKTRYWMLYYLFELVAIMKLQFFKVLERVRLQKT